MIKIIAVLFLFPSFANATPYFRLFDPSHPQPVVGSLLNPGDLSQSAAASLLPIITHSPKDGCLFPKMVCEDWTPLAVGASMNAGKITLDVAPLGNVLPWMQRGALSVLPDSYSGLRSILTPSSGSEPITFSAGPVWEYSQRQNKGFFKLFVGVQLKF